MAVTPIEALRADRAALLAICAGFTDSDWKAASGCLGWTVQDLVAHMGALYWAVVDPSVLPDVTGLPTERAQDRYVEARRSLGAGFEVPLGDLGTYPARVLPTAFCFDHYLHIRADMFAPRGPLTGEPPRSDELRLMPALD